MFREIILPKHVELTEIINKPLLLHVVGCLYYLFQWCTVKQTSDNEIYLLIKYIKNVLWRESKRLSYIEEARCLKVKPKRNFQQTEMLNAAEHIRQNETWISGLIIELCLLDTILPL